MRGRGFLALLFSAFALFALPLWAVTLTITAPADQARLDLNNGEFFNVSWTCDYSTTQVELWVDGRAYCSLCGSGYSGTIFDVDSWLNPPFLNQCWHTLQLKAIVGGGWYYSAPIIIYDSTYPGDSKCAQAPECAIPAAGRPVDVASGKMWADQEDLRIEGPLPPVFSRRYNQRLEATNGPLGYGWTHAYNMTVWTSLGTGHFRDGGGHEVLFAAKLNTVHIRHFLCYPYFLDWKEDGRWRGRKRFSGAGRGSPTILAWVC